MIHIGLRSLLTLTAALVITTSGLSASVITEAEGNGTAVNNSLATAQTIPTSAFTLPVPATVFNPPGYTTATVQGSGGFNDVDFFRFFAYGGRLLLDMDNPNPAFDPILALFDSTGTLLAYSDDSPLDSGSVNTIDAFLGSYLLPGSGTYFVAVSESPNFPTAALTGTQTRLTRPDGAAGGFAVSGVAPGVATFDFNGAQPGGGQYTLHISAADAVVPEPATTALVGSALLAAVLTARRIRRS